ncbi:hypothetical protein ACE193_08025 [Bernardetia sp. OM2101]|uniref:hypothetical protein n=1 Tax=Bernardetia sp. OM2101 TaxID=3344876 RepID=UPI0035D09152
MKNLLVLLMLFISTLSFGQNIETGKLWRTKGVYDSLGNFMEQAKVQIFLYSTTSNQFHRMETQDRINMKSGETNVFVYRDTLNLTSLDDKIYKLNEEETMTVHTNDSLTINYKGYTLSYVKLNEKPSNTTVNKLKKELIKAPLFQSIEKVKEYRFTYQENGLVKTKTLDRDYEWESEYKIIDFNGFVFLQGITSAPKLITKVEKGKIEFLEIDYRFENKEGKLAK